VRWGILIPHRIWSLCVNSPSQYIGSVDVVDGKLLCISRVDQNVMGVFNSPSHVVGVHHPTMCDGEFEFPITVGRCVVIPHRRLLFYVDVIDGKLLCSSRLGQNVMGNFNSSSHVVGAHHPTMCDGEV
jgi:hypothetical protein